MTDHGTPEDPREPAAVREIEPPPPLADCFRACETVCVVECCGIDAISTERADIQRWIADVGPQLAAQAQRQLDELVGAVRDERSELSSDSLNAAAFDDASRGVLLEFLAAFQRAFAGAD